jgi:cytochrome c553
MRTSWRLGIGLLLGVFAWPVVAGEVAQGEAIYRDACANCHGERGQGGKDGEYPRLAGQYQAYVERQLADFRDRKRQNKPMIPIFKSGRLQEEDIAAVAAYLAALEPPAPGEVKVPEEIEGDMELGLEIYERDCILCHGPDGRGKPEKDSPQLVRQYPRYIAKQLSDFRNGERWHEYQEEMFGEAYPDELDAVIGYVLLLNHQLKNEE